MYLQDDVFTHLYTLVVRPDNTYEVKIDNAKVESGSLEEDWDFLSPQKIKVNLKSLQQALLKSVDYQFIVKMTSNDYVRDISLSFLCLL